MIFNPIISTVILTFSDFDEFQTAFSFPFEVSKCHGRKRTRFFVFLSNYQFCIDFFVGFVHFFFFALHVSFFFFLYSPIFSCFLLSVLPTLSLPFLPSLYSLSLLFFLSLSPLPSCLLLSPIYNSLSTLPFLHFLIPSHQHQLRSLLPQRPHSTLSLSPSFSHNLLPHTYSSNPLGNEGDMLYSSAPSLPFNLFFFFVPSSFSLLLANPSGKLRGMFSSLYDSLSPPPLFCIILYLPLISSALHSAGLSSPPPIRQNSRQASESRVTLSHRVTTQPFSLPIRIAGQQHGICFRSSALI